jgi:dTDP-4-dehydrorhamnose reductase
MSEPKAHNPSILILGANGMLGSMLTCYLSSKPLFCVSATTRRTDLKSENLFFEIDSFLKNPEQFNFLNSFDYIINCLAMLKPECDRLETIDHQPAYKINSLLVERLSQFVNQKVKILHISTDGVFSGDRAPYTEERLPDAKDLYGKSKAQGEIQSQNLISFRCSIIGPESATKRNFFEWAISQPKGAELNGFNNQLWNGITTLQLANFIEQLVLSERFSELRSINHLFHLSNSALISPDSGQIFSKFDLLSLINQLFELEYKIRSIRSEKPAQDLRLMTNYPIISELFKNQDLSCALSELKLYLSVYREFLNN